MAKVRSHKAAAPPTNTTKTPNAAKPCAANVPAQPPPPLYHDDSAFEIGKILFESMNVTFDTVSDVMPAGRKKYIHSEGYVAKFQFVPNPDT